jgi:DNA-directed RNA polymerase specialized sigma24 family protein
MPPTTALSPDLLLQHEPFVRALVRALVPDEARAQDVVQETWLTALRRPPRALPLMM